ncbi:hypothetical protein WS70_06115 [Burkholderia mayonis]|uniref:Uncharacterized protein n=1 Tax=Burkholderia mayonis TaxID=1385591 RepID=A0A1B4FCS6_9BURK|nr:hypothetical protein WS70_06115 [Burkholderia mayonis]KVE34980.1 hypothetical protein WS69_15485 [Burkholderia sp. BDU5]
MTAAARIAAARDRRRNGWLPANDADGNEIRGGKQSGMTSVRQPRRRAIRRAQRNGQTTPENVYNGENRQETNAYRHSAQR